MPNKRKISQTTKGSKKSGSAPSTRNHKQTADEEMGDDATCAAGNSSVGDKTRQFCSFLNLRVTVVESKKGTSTMKSKFQEILKLLQEADDSAILSYYKTDPTTNDKGEHTISVNNILSSPHNFPDSITGLSKYFFGGRPNSKGGAIWSQIRLMHSSPIDNLLEDTREDLREMNCGLHMQAIQHWDVAAIGFLKNLHPDVDGSAFEEFFNNELRRHFPAGKHIIGLKLKTPFDGKKAQYDSSVSFRDKIRAYHVETVGTVKDAVLHKLKSILLGDAFSKRYNCGVRLVPVYDKRSSPYTQDKIRKCILQHSQWCQCITSMPLEGIAFLDQPNSKLQKRSLRQLILELPNAHFISIDNNWSRTHYCALFPKKYEHQAKCRVANLGAYLHKEYGDHILLSLSAEQQQVIQDTVWDEETGRPISKVEKELDDILDLDDNLDYVDTSFMESATSGSVPAASSVCVPRASPVPMNFVPVADESSVSTFGTAVFKTPKKSIDPHLQSSRDAATISSSITMESRVSQVESTLGDMKTMLEHLVQATSQKGSPSLGKAGIAE